MCCVPYYGAESKIIPIYKVFIYLSCINTQRQITAPFDITPVISYSDHRTTGLYQDASDFCEGYFNSDIIRLLQQSQIIHYCNQSVLAIVPDLNKFVFSSKIFDLVSKSALVRFCFLRASYLYKSTGPRLYILCL